ncbi:hypothetical protein BAE44_0008178 [Dichanthelium oligosanthes]|uniref:Uncharacterized protein n=1 Tax=Dichanthelium oligosanthes TaxID=888268 RepID=A0A1E5W0C1_9POAL|nr:hypothetical protein BAE44_0008178 [Dichanthelium oligosanthes]
MAMATAPDQQQLPAAASSASPRLRVLETTLVPPSPSPPETSLPLTFFDIIWLNPPPVQRLLFYHLAPDTDFATSPPSSPTSRTPCTRPSAPSTRSPAASASPPARPTATSCITAQVTP